MHSANPMVHLRHAWDATRSVWGKVAIVLLYVFIWSSIISAGVAFIWPGSQGMHCLLGVITDDWTCQFAITMYRSSSLWAIGFFLYADMGGIRVSNVAMVTVFTTILTVTGYLAMTNGAGPPPPPDDAACVADTNAGLLAGVIVGLVWIWITLFCSIMEKQVSGNTGTAGETTPMM
jgi:hypothetical protein